jgi:hypothetical protein
MIYQLVKRRVEWKVAAAFAAVCAFVGFLGTGQFALFTVALMYLIALFMNQKRCTLFEAALPLHARDLFCARMLASAALIWLPILSGIVSFTLRGAAGWQHATLFLEIGIILSCGVVTVQSVHITQFDVPGWWKVTVVFWAAIAIAMIYTGARIRSPQIVVTLCVLGSTALMLKTWGAIPETFQLAPERAVSEGFQNWRIPLPTVWAPVLRGVFSNPGPALFIFALIQDPSRDPILTGFIAGCLALVSIGDLQKAQWLLALPVSRWKLFIARLFPTAFCLSAAFLFSDFDQQPSRLQLIMVLTAAMMALLGTLAGTVLFVPRFRLPLRYSIAPFLIYGFLLLIDLYLQHWYGSRRGPNLFVAWLSRILSANPLLFLSIASALIAALCWLAYAGFRQMEAGPRRKQRTA